MDIYKILTEDSDSVLMEDLNFFEIELATGNYEKEYVDKCLQLINDIRTFRMIKFKQSISNEKPDTNSTTETNPKNQTSVSSNDFIKKQIIQYRSYSNYNAFMLLQLLKDNNVGEAYIDKNFDFFQPYEMNVLLQSIDFSEKFIEKYMNLLDCKIVSKYQLFSEEFFMKHFDKLNYTLVLKQGKNPWKNKNARSTKLNVFLKLKGIKI